MEALSTVDIFSFIASAIILVVYFALRRIASCMADDVYSLFKRFAGWIFSRGRRANPQAIIAADKGTGSTAIAPAIDLSKPSLRLTNHSPMKTGQTDAQPMCSTARGDYDAFENFTTGDLANLSRILRG